MSSLLSHPKARLSLIALAVAAVTLVANVPAQASLTLTPAGIADGFVLTTYASGGSTNDYTFLAAAPLTNGNLAVVDFHNGFLRAYPDVNGQTPGSALSSQALPGAVNIANAGGNTYAAVRGGGLFQVSSSLGLTPVTVPNFTFQNGLAGNPITGHLLAAGSGPGGFGIYDFTPGAGVTPTLINANGYDGVSVSPDGTTVYGAVGGSVLGFNIATHAQVFSFALHGGAGPDGTGVIFGGTFNGFVISNNNDGTVSLINPAGTIETIIASGGSRGDFTSPDTNNGTLLMSEFDSMFRLAAPGGTFGPGPTAVPEPTSLALFGVMAVGGAIYRWRRRKPGLTRVCTGR
jgi:hypothetical protein